MTRIFRDFIGGTIDNAPLTDTGTTLSGPFLAGLPVVAAPHTMSLTLDPDGVDGLPELVTVTAHTTSATTATIVRGANNREHLAGTTVVHAVTADDMDVSVGSFPVGVPVPWLGSTPPTGYLLCDGSAVSRTTYPVLFAVCGTTYGAGNGSTTFNLPDMRQRFVLGQAASGVGATRGSTGGTISHTHTQSAHSHGAGGLSISAHSFSDRDDAARQHATGGILLSVPSGSGSPPSGQQIILSSGASMGAANHAVSGNTQSVNAGDTGAANPPFIALPYIVKAG